MELDLKHQVICTLKDLHESMGRVPMKHELQKHIAKGIDIDIMFGCYDYCLAAAGLLHQEDRPDFQGRKPKIFTIDIECLPMEVFVWQLKTEYVPHDMIKRDWSLLSFAAKQSDSDQVIYHDVSKQDDVRDDKELCKKLWDLLNDADIIITQNGIKFDIPKMNGKFEEYGFGPPLPFKHKDTYRIKKQLGLSSNKLAFSTNKLNKRYKKLDHSKFPGNQLFIACLNKNQEAFSECRNYNIHDVLSTEELYFEHLIKWDRDAVNFGVYMNKSFVCKRCGSDELEEKWLDVTMAGAYQGFVCSSCGSFSKGKTNLLKKSIRQGLLK